MYMKYANLACDIMQYIHVVGHGMLIKFVHKPAVSGESDDTKLAETFPDDGGFRVPTPQLHFSDIWDSSKSLPSSSWTAHSGSKRPHSCHHSEMQKQTSKIEPHMPPATWEVTPSPTSNVYVAPPTDPSPTPSMSISTLSLKSNLAQAYTTPSQSAESAGMGYPPVMYNAWTMAKPSAPNTRHTALTSSRLMTK